MRIAIIGGGAAGLSAAWCLSKQHEVTLYERNDWLGGHARTVDVRTSNGLVPVDMAFAVYQEWIFTNFSALLDALGVETVGTLHHVSASFPEGAWISGRSTPLWRTIHDERSEEHTSELQSHSDLVCRLLLEKK